MAEASAREDQELQKTAADEQRERDEAESSLAAARSNALANLSKAQLGANAAVVRAIFGDPFAPSSSSPPAGESRGDGQLDYGWRYMPPLKGGARRNHWIKMLEEFAVDLILVQETFPQHKHLPPLLYPNSQVRLVWEMVKQTGWGSAVISSSGAMRLVPVHGFPGWCVGAEISGAAWQIGIADPLLVFSVHAPDGASRYQGQVNKLLDEIKGVADGREFVVGGDFNLTISRGPDPALPSDKWDLAIQERLSGEFGLLNCWQAANPGQPLAQTLRWSG
jgi:hypothetical protein